LLKEKGHLMTECNRDGIGFSRVKGKKLVADFDGGQITSDAGVVLLREVDRRLGLIGAIDACIADPRNQEMIVHDQRTLLAQRILGIALGYEDLNDHQTLRDDPLFQAVTERGINQEVPLASPSTLCRLENRITRDSLFAMAAVFVDQFVKSHRRPPKELILDFDATDDPLHGQQVGRFFHGYYDHYCFLPLYVFCGDQLLTAYLRPSNIDPSKHARAILKLLVERFRRVWPKVRIVLRADSGFCRWKLMRWCDRHDVYYILGLARNAVLERLAEPYAAAAKQQFDQTGEKQRLFANVSYGAETWDRERRVIVKAEHLKQGPNSRFVVTNLPGDSQDLYDDVYCQRGEMENRIKEQQLDLFADRTSCHDFVANQFRLLLSAAAYVLMETFRRTTLKNTELEHAQVGTIRLKLLKIGARVKTSVRRIVLHLATGFPLQPLFRRLAQRLTVPVQPQTTFT
jgi:hypothetical protein